MSIFVGELLPSGIVFAADKNLTLTHTDQQGRAVATVQDVGTKILCWPHSKALLGYVGCASVGTRRMDVWLYDFIGDHVDFTDSASVATDLRDRLQQQLGRTAPATIVQFATFGQRNGFVVPEYWHITNVPGIDADGEYEPPSPDFVASERLLGFHLQNVAFDLNNRPVVVGPDNIREYLRQRAEQFAPYWFHQGIGLRAFNTISEAARQAFLALHRAGDVEHPQTLDDWGRYAKMWVLIYGAYFDALGRPGERFVGGGADVLSIPWPE